MSIQGPLGVLGFGNMGAAIVNGLIEGRHLNPLDILAYDPSPERIDAASEMGITAMTDGAALAAASRILLVAVKPQQMEEALDEIRSSIDPATLVVSIAAGFRIARIEDCLAPNVRICRVMPNTPALVGAGAAALAFNENCTEEDRNTVQTMFEAVGIVEFVSEDRMDAVTAVCGSGPAYFFRLVECIIAAGVAEGLSEAQASNLAIQTCYGAGKLLHDSGEPPAVLRERVTSKGGTTAAALAAFQEQGLDRIVAAAVSAAANRSKELGG